MKIFQRIECFSSVLILLLSGCSGIYRSTQISDPSVPTAVSAVQVSNGLSVMVPQAADDPTAEPPSQEKTSARKTVSEAAMEQKAEKKLAEFPPNPEQKVTAVKAVPAPPPRRKEKPAPENGDKTFPHRQKSPENYRRGPGMWRAFSRLTEKEQEDLLKIQRTDPERFRAIMLEKADHIYEAERKMRLKLDELALAYHQTSDQAKKAELKKELRKNMHEDFLQRLQDTRRDIESHKRRTALMEKELQKREKNCDAIVDAMLEYKLTDKEFLMENNSQK